MYINRAKALLLVGTISAGCASTKDDEGPGAAGAAGSGTGGSSSSAGGSGQGAAGAGSGGTPSAGGGGQSGGGTGGSPSTGGSDPSGGGTGGTPSSGGPDAGDLDAGNPDGSDAGGDAGGTLTCDDTVDTVVDCSSLEQNECLDIQDFLSSECEMLEFIMKPATTNAARNCMIALEPPELCEATNTYTCIAEALDSSCPDPDADDECSAIAVVCDSSPPLLACSSALSGMTQDGRDQMVQCMTEESCDLYACIEGLS